MSNFNDFSENGDSGKDALIELLKLEPTLAAERLKSLEKIDKAILLTRLRFREGCDDKVCDVLRAYEKLTKGKIPLPPKSEPTTEAVVIRCLHQVPLNLPVRSIAS